MARPQVVTDDTIIEALAAMGEAKSEELAARLGIGQSTATKRLAVLEAAGMARRQAGGRVKGVRAPDRWSVVAAAEDSPVTDAPGAGGAEGIDVEDHATAPIPGHAPEGSERLGRGALGALVRDYLAARPDEDLGPTQVGKALGRSQGAVANALSRLEAAGEAQLVSTFPRRYRITAKAE